MFCPVRDISFALSQRSPLALEWMALSGVALLETLRGKGTSLLSLQQKCIVYKSLYKSLTGVVAVSDAVINAIIMAELVESRVSDLEAAYVHLQGYEKAVRSRGSIRELITSSSSPLLSAVHIMPYLACGLPASEIIYGEGASNLVISILRRFVMGENNTEPAFFLYTIFPHFSSPQPLYTQLMLPKEICLRLVSGSLAPYLQPGRGTYPRYETRTSHFAALFAIAFTLWKLQGNEVLLSVFFKRSNTLLQEMCGYQVGSSSLTPQGLMWIVLKTAFDVNELMETKKIRMDYHAKQIIDVASALKLFAASHDIVRQEMVYFLYRFLLHENRSVTTVSEELV